MKQLILTLGLVFIATPAFAASAVVPVSVTIINLTTMPIAEAIAFCDERNMECPALRKKYEQERAQNASFQEREGQNGSIEVTGQYADTLRVSEVGYYIE